MTALRRAWSSKAGMFVCKSIMTLGHYMSEHHEYLLCPEAVPAHPIAVAPAAPLTPAQGLVTQRASPIHFIALADTVSN